MLWKYISFLTTSQVIFQKDKISNIQHLSISVLCHIIFFSFGNNENIWCIWWLFLFILFAYTFICRPIYILKSFSGHVYSPTIAVLQKCYIIIFCIKLFLPLTKCVVLQAFQATKATYGDVNAAYADFI